MSSLAGFCVSSSGFTYKNCDDIIPIDKVAVRTEVSGFFVDRIRTEAISIKSILVSIEKVLPSITSGPISNLSVEYNKISSLSGLINSAVNEADKDMPVELQCSGLLMEAFNQLSQFCQFIPHLVSPTAASMVSYIPSLQQNLKIVIENLEKIIVVTAKCDEFIEAQCGDISFSDFSFSHQAVVMLHLIEYIIIDLNFFLAYDGVQTSTQCQQNIQKWLQAFSQFSNSLFSKALLNTQEIWSSIDILMSVSPNLFEVVSSAHSISNDNALFYSLIDHSLLLMQIINEIQQSQYTEPINCIIEGIQSSYKESDLPKEIIPSSLLILDFIEQRYKVGLYNEDDYLQCFLKNSREVLRNSDNLKHNLHDVLCSISRSFAYIAPTIDQSTRIYNKLAEILVLSLNESLISAQKESKVIDNLFVSRIELFNEFAMGEVNYFIKSLISMNSFRLDNGQFLSDAIICFSSCQSLTRSLKKLIDTCEHDETIIVSLTAILKSFELLSTHLYFDLNQLLITISMNTMKFSTDVLRIIKYYHDSPICGNKNHPLFQEINDIESIIKQSHNHLVVGLDDALKLNQFIGSIFGQICELKSNMNPTITVDAKILIERGLKYLGKISDYRSEMILVSLRDLSFINQAYYFVSAILSLLSRIELSIPSNEDYIYHLKIYISYSSALSISSFIQLNADFRDQLEHFPQTIRTSLDVIWNMSTQSPQKVSNYISSLNRMLDELKSIVELLPQPFIEVIIPESLRITRNLEKICPTLPSHNSQMIGYKLLNEYKSTQNSLILEFMSKWFDVSTSLNCSLNDSIENLMKDVISSGLSVRNDFRILFDNLTCFLSSLVSFIDLTMLTHTKERLIVLLTQSLNLCLESMSISNDYFVYKIYSYLWEIKTLVSIDQYPLAQRERDIIIEIKNILILLQNIQNGQNSGFEQTMNSIRSISSLKVLILYPTPHSSIYIQNQIDFSLMDLFSGSTTSIDQTVGVLSKCLQDLLPDGTNDKQNEIDIICDSVYDRAETIRECSMSLIRCAKNHDMNQNEIDLLLWKVSSCAYDAIRFTYCFLNCQDLLKSQISVLYSKETNQLLVNLIAFVSTAQQMLSLDDYFSAEAILRKEYRGIAKKLDEYLNIVEQQTTPSYKSPFEDRVAHMIGQISQVFVQISRLVSRIQLFSITHIYNDEKEIIASSLISSIELANASINIVANDAVEPCFSIFKDEFTGFIDSCKSFVTIYKSMKASDCYQDFEKIINPLLLAYPQLISKAQTLLDHIVILPDPEAAAKIPDDFIISPMQSLNMSTTDAFDALAECNILMKSCISGFLSIFADDNSSSQSLLVSFSQLRKEAETFSMKVLSLASVTSDSRYQVELQTSLHTFASSFISIQDALRSRLMRSSTYETEMKESISSFDVEISKLMNIADQAAKSIPEISETNDEVTSELRATAAAIEEMSARLKSFGEQFNVEENEEAPEEEDNMSSSPSPDSLPAFVIAESAPILKAASLILKRAQEITKDLVSQFGHLDNEKLLIGSAQELTEAAGLIMICAETLIEGSDDNPEFTIIAAAKIVKGTVSQLVAQVLVQGGDPEGIMNKHVKTVRICSDRIVRKAEALAQERFALEEAKKPRKASNKLVQKLNMQNKVIELRKAKDEDEKMLYQYRKAKK